MLPIKYINNGEFSEWDFKQLKSTYTLVEGISNYEQRPYEGNWILIARDDQGMFQKYDCGHCSYRWPLENWYGWLFTKDEIIKLIESMDSFEATKAEKELFLNFVNKD